MLLYVRFIARCAGSAASDAASGTAAMAGNLRVLKCVPHSFGIAPCNDRWTWLKLAFQMLQDALTRRAAPHWLDSSRDRLWKSCKDRQFGSI